MCRLASPCRRFLGLLLGFLALAPTVAPAAVCDGISTVSHVPLTTVRVASSLTRPVLVTAPPDDVARLFIVLQDGTVQILKDGVLLGTPFLDLSALTRSPADVGGSANEEGLLGLAFAPDYATSGRFFVYHTDTTGANNLLARYTRSESDPDLADTASRQLILNFPHPTNSNHNGGMIAFGPDDGYLYIGTGDGGGSCDSPGNAQNLSSLQGKLHRIDVSGATYTIPADNPFVGTAGAREEIWSYGLRNPWRWSFDRLSSDIYIGDVGQGRFEEVDYALASSPGGENYGWDHYEGATCPNPSCAVLSCALASYAPPILDYDQTIGSRCAVTGGYVYRGCRMPGLAGTYFYADYCAAFIKTFNVVGGVATNQVDRTAELAPGGGLGISLITSFGEDARGEVYVIDATSGGGGEVFKIVPVLTNLEVSGVGAVPFELGSALWSWEDLKLTSSHPIVSYHVYRQIDGIGDFVCIHSGAGTSWSGGDPDVPPDNSWYSYLVVARTAAGTQSSPGTGTGGSPRVLSTATCPP